MLLIWSPLWVIHKLSHAGSAFLYISQLPFPEDKVEESQHQILRRDFTNKVDGESHGQNFTLSVSPIRVQGIDVEEIV
jgi:hypothetical protein